MNIWLIQTGELLPIRSDVRKMRTAVLADKLNWQSKAKIMKACVLLPAGGQKTDVRDLKSEDGEGQRSDVGSRISKQNK